MSEGSGGPTNVRSLNDAIRRVRIAETDRADVMSDLQEAERARLDILAEELREVFAEVPAEDEQFIFRVSGGTQPRLWIDSTAFVAVGRDRRTYRFLKDTRLGRSVILEATGVDDIADTVTNYIAERIIERERTIEGDWLVKRALRDERKRGVRKVDEIMAALPDSGPRPRRIDNRHLGWVVAGFLGGILIGAIALLAYAWVRVPIG